MRAGWRGHIIPIFYTRGQRTALLDTIATHISKKADIRILSAKSAKISLFVAYNVLECAMYNPQALERRKDALAEPVCRAVRILLMLGEDNYNHATPRNE